MGEGGAGCVCVWGRRRAAAPRGRTACTPGVHGLACKACRQARLGCEAGVGAASRLGCDGLQRDGRSRGGCCFMQAGGDARGPGPRGAGQVPTDTTGRGNRRGAGRGQVQERLVKATQDMAALHATCLQQQRAMQADAKLVEQLVSHSLCHIPLTQLIARSQARRAACGPAPSATHPPPLVRPAARATLAPASGGLGECADPPLGCSGGPPHHDPRRRRCRGGAVSRGA